MTSLTTYGYVIPNEHRKHGTPPHATPQPFINEWGGLGLRGVVRGLQGVVDFQLAVVTSPKNKQRIFTS